LQNLKSFPALSFNDEAMPGALRDAEFFRNWNRHRRKYFIKLTLVICAFYVLILVILLGYFVIPNDFVILISMLVLLSAVFLLAVYFVISNPPRHSSPEEQKIQTAPTM
jgi:hypothetical protein